MVLDDGDWTPTEGTGKLYHNDRGVHSKLGRNCEEIWHGVPHFKAFDEHTLRISKRKRCDEGCVEALSTERKHVLNFMAAKK